MSMTTSPSAGRFDGSVASCDRHAPDGEYVAAVGRALAVACAGVPDPSAAVDHRRLAAGVLALVAAAASPAFSQVVGGPAEDLLDRAYLLAAGLTDRRGAEGLFRGGDNVASPPDSAFSLGDLADAAAILSRRPAGAAAGPASRLVGVLSTLLREAVPALLSGGVHTPNHRWEVSATLARMHRASPDPALLARARRWLAEGVDLDADGQYSERSANYAAHVSDPALLTLADALDRPDLLAVVERNLTGVLDLLLPDGTVETVHSRRQDQRDRIPLAVFGLPLRAVALRRQRADLAWAAEIALAQGVADPVAAAAACLLRPWTAGRLPPSRPPAVRRRSVLTGSGLAVEHAPGATTVVFGGSDYARHGRIRSGLSNSPTFLRLFAGEAVLDSVRLSRVFFGLGPFRADGLRAEPDGGWRLTESVSAAYYLPLPEEELRADGAYDLADEGRFSAAMSFRHRPRHEVRLDTQVRVRPLADGADVAVRVDGPSVDWALELAFRPGGVLTGAVPLDEGRWLLAPPERPAGPARAWYRVGDDVLEVTVSGLDGSGGPLAPPDGPVRYEPGEEYEFLGGTDAADGLRLYVAGRAPASVDLSIRASRTRCQVTN